jgi:tetraprenyl-beta-curcumene synthase
MYDDVRWAAGHVATSGTRFSMLAGGGFGGAVDLVRFLTVVLPRTSKALAGIRAIADAVPDDRLRAQALGSIDGKAYHVAGSGILATFLTPAAADHYIEIVAPLESIYDYLDNLCDRHPDVGAAAYPVLHRAIAHALNPAAPVGGYYDLGPSGDDGDYLVTLVRHVQRGLRRLADHELLLPLFSEAATLYAEMQSFVHLPAGERERTCRLWFERHQPRFGDLEWQEFACAAGSQFQVYAPLFMLFDGKFDAIQTCYDAYFPAVSALHVLFDSFIDQQEDREHGDLSFVAAYNGVDHLRERVAYLARRAVHAFGRLPNPERHRFLLRTMALFYLTHPKVYAQKLDETAQALIAVIDEALEQGSELVI